MEMDQSLLDEFADTLGIQYSVLDNLSDGRPTYRGSINITNNSKHPLEYGKWGIYLCHIRMIEPDYLAASKVYVFPDVNIQVKHINGCLFVLEPVKEFKPMATGETIEVLFNGQFYSVAKTDIFPNWYIFHEGLEPRVIQSTSGEALDFITDFDSPEKWKRFDYELPGGKRRLDICDPWTPEIRYQHNDIGTDNLHPEINPVIPTPYKMELKSDEHVDLKQSGWTIRCPEQFRTDALFLADKLGLDIVDVDDQVADSKDRTITLSEADVTDGASQCPAEAYSVNIRADLVTIRAATSAGAFYGIQTLLSLCQSDNVAPVGHILDFPRFSYRGMHLDVSRNFHGKQEVLDLLDVMAAYKMNRLHLHLVDDEGWRLQIPGLPELTQVGGQRGHDMKEENCLHPVLGSGPTPGISPGSGFYTVQDYREILKYATSRHIEVIPEIDMPGHSHAAIVSMTTRYHRLIKDGKSETEAKQYLLTDPDTQSQVQSVQMFSNNVLDPGLETTFTFIDKVISEVKAMHKDICPMTVFHLGGDEVPFEAFLDSPKCQALLLAGEIETETDVMAYFIKRVAKIANSHGLDVAAWHDGIVMEKNHVCRRSDFENKEVLVYAWRNGMAADTVKLANAGYKVVMSQASHLYFDHPYEPNPDDRGLYWSCRYIDTEKVFGFMPDSLYDNDDLKVTGEPISEAELKTLAQKSKVALEKPENIIGMQGHLWTELVRTPEQLQEMVVPRILALAERSWHKASWEEVTERSQRLALRKKDWVTFAATLGAQELPRLEKMGVAYCLPRPGAKISKSETDRRLTVNLAYPGLPVYYSTDGGTTWNRYTQHLDVTDTTSIKLVTRSCDGKRSSPVVSISL